MLFRNIVKSTVVGSLVLCSLVFGVSSAFAYEKWMAGGFGPRPTTAVIHPLSSLDSASITAMKNAAAQYNSSAVNAGTLASIGTNTSQTTYPVDNELNEVTKGARGSNSYLMETFAITTGLVWNGIWWVNTIYEADVDINISEPWGNGAAGSNDIGNAFTHELGHVLGLGEEPDVTDATMFPGAAPGETKKRTLDTDDIYGLKDIY